MNCQSFKSKWTTFDVYRAICNRHGALTSA